MNKELFNKVGVAAFGDSWQSQMQRELNINSRQRISQWAKGTRTIPNLEAELLTILKIRSSEIDNAINLVALKKHSDKTDYSAVYTTVSEGGELLDERFDTLEEAEKWVNQQYDEDDMYLIKYHEMTEAELCTLQVIQEYADLFEREELLQLIHNVENYSDTKKVQDVYLDLAPLVFQNEYAADYFDYYFASVFMYKTERLRKKTAMSAGGLATPPDEDEFIESPSLITYKDFLKRKISNQIKFIAEYF